MNLRSEIPSENIEGVIPLSLHYEEVLMAMIASAAITAAALAVFFLFVFEIMNRREIDQ